MSSKAERMRQEEEVNALIQASNSPTPDNGNTGQEENHVPSQSQEKRTPPAPEQAPNGDSDQTWKAKYEVLKGKYNAEVPRLRAQLQEAQDASNNVDISQYQTRINELEKQVSDLTAQQGQNNNSDITNDDIERKLADEYGDDFAGMIVNLIAKKGGGGSDQGYKQLHDKVDKLEQDNAKTQQEAAQQLYANKIKSLTEILKAKNINFKEVDEDPLYHEWLEQHMPQTGMPRQHFLQRNFANNDLNAVAQFYIDFKAHERSTFNNNPLADHVDAAGDHGAPDSGSDEDTWTVTEMQAFYADVRKRSIGTGPLAEKSQEYVDKLEQSLNRAMQNGRLIDR